MSSVFPLYPPHGFPTYGSLADLQVSYICELGDRLCFHVSPHFTISHAPNVTNYGLMFQSIVLCVIRPSVIPVSVDKKSKRPILFRPY